MARRWTATLACISLLYLQLPAALSRRPGGGGRPARPREPPARSPASGPQPPAPARRPAVWKLRQAPRPQRRAHWAPPTGPRPRAGPPGRRQGPPRPGARLMRVGCGLATCQAQRLGHRLWQLVASAGPRDSAPVDPSSPYSYG